MTASHASDRVKPLSVLCAACGAAAPAGAEDIRVTDIVYDSRRVTPGSLFVAVRGAAFDGHAFVQNAIDAGAAAALVEERPPDIAGTFPLCIVTDSRAALADAAAEFYDHPSQSVRVIGITGTNGKTTTTYLVEAIAAASALKPSVLGTIAYRVAGDEAAAPTTTPESADLQKMLRTMADKKSRVAIMEVSSHALEQGRTRATRFAVTAFTNLSRDHLDYHADMESYFQAKRKLFVAPGAQEATAVINIDDPYGARLADELGDRCMRVSTQGAADVSVVMADVTGDGTRLRLRTPMGTIDVRSALIGSVNVQNIALAVGIACAAKFSHGSITTGIPALRGVPGRLERVTSSRANAPRVFVDYAHTPDALSKALDVLRPLTDGKLIVVVGCGGDRDAGKRPLMGDIATRLADYAVITSDNPRTEDPAAIIEDIRAGITTTENFDIVVDRTEAIRRAIAAGAENDTVLIAGKGHEDYQIIGTTKHPFDDRVVARDVLESGSGRR